MRTDDLSLSCLIALALYGHYITLGAEEKLEHQRRYILDTYKIDAEDFMDEPEIIRIEELLFN